MEIRTIRGEITDVQSNWSIRKCQEKIRQLNDRISSMGDSIEKENVLKELKAVAYKGLTRDLTQMIEGSQLHLVALNLVLNHLTDVTNLEKYYKENFGKPDMLEKAGLVNLTSRLKPKNPLEVLCALVDKSIDVSKGWAGKLCKKATNLHELTRLTIEELRDCCEGAQRKEIKDVFEVILRCTKERNQREQRPAISQNETLVRGNNERKNADIQELKKAQAQLNNAKEALPSIDLSEVSKRISIIVKLLHLPEKWINEKEMTDIQFLDALSPTIDHCIKSVESAEEYKSEVDVITNVSNGRALCGLYHSEYDSPKAAESQLLQVPTNVKFCNPGLKEEIKNISFRRQGLASNYVKKVADLSCRTNLCISGLNGMPSVSVGAGFQSQSQDGHCVNTSSRTASVVNSFQVNQKTFHFQRKDIRLSSDCMDEALRIALCIFMNNDDDKPENQARKFLNRYGSHFPRGTQTLGGIFFTIADAESQGNMDEETILEKTKLHLKGQISFPFFTEEFGLGGNVSGSKGSKEKRIDENNEILFSYSRASMGPPANPATFHKLLSYNSTWALIDRGSLTDNIAVWDIIKDLEGVFEDVATILKKTWDEDESKRKTKWDERERRHKEEKARTELLSIKKEHFEKQVRFLIDFTNINLSICLRCHR